MLHCIKKGSLVLLIIIVTTLLLMMIWIQCGTSHPRSFNSLSPTSSSTIVNLPSLTPALPVRVPLSPLEYPPQCHSTVHVAMVASGEIGSRHLYITIKSVLMYRSTPLHFHFITDDRAKTVLQTMMSTWLVPAVSHDYYDLAQVLTSISSNSTDSQIHCSSQSLSIHLNLDLILPNTIQHVIVIEPASVVTVDLAQLSALTVLHSNRTMTVCQTRCLLYCSEGSQIDLTKWGAVGINLQRQALKLEESTHMQKEADGGCKPEDVDIVDDVMVKLFNTPSHDATRVCSIIMRYDGELIRYKKMKCLKDMELLVPKPPSKADICRLFEWERRGYRRELPFLLGHSYKSSGDHDVTMTTHLDYNRLNLLERILAHWDGPASVAIHVTDSQVQGVLDFLLNSKSLRHRKNVFYHLLFRVGPSYPPNHGRELAHRFVSTPYIFILDVDFVSSIGLYETLMEKLKANAFGDMDKTAVVIPAFETNYTNFSIPYYKSKMISLFTRGKVSQFRVNFFQEGHASTDYNMWMNTTETYSVQWADGYEPYYLLKTSVFSFDHRFIARFRDKCSHSTELHMAGYKFLVFPEVFIVHLPHEVSAQNIDQLKTCDSQWYTDWLLEKRVRYHYSGDDIIEDVF